MAINKGEVPKVYKGLIALDKIGMDIQLSRTYNKMASFLGVQTLRASSVDIDSIAPQRSGKAYATKTGMTLSKTSDIPPLNGYLIAPQLCVDTQHIWEKIEAWIQKNPDHELSNALLQKFLKESQNFYEAKAHVQTVQALKYWQTELESHIKQNGSAPAKSPIELLRHIISHTPIPEDDPNIIFTKSAPDHPSKHDGFNKKDREHLLEHIVAKKEEINGNPNFRKMQIGAVTESIGAILLKAQKKPPEYLGLEYNATMKMLFFQSAKHPEQYYCISLSEYAKDTHEEQLIREQSPRKALALDAKILIPAHLKHYTEIREALRYEKFTTVTVYKANKAGNQLSASAETIPVLTDYKSRPFFGDWDSLFQSVPLALKLPTWSTTPINTFEDPINSIQTLEALTKELAYTMFSHKPGEKLNAEMQNLLDKLERDGYVKHIKNSNGSGYYNLEPSFFVPFISERAGCITAYEFLTGQLTNYAYRGAKAFSDPTANPKQHGNEVRNPYPPSKIDGALSHHTGSHTAITNGEQACVDWYLDARNQSFFKENGLDINPKFNLNIWGPIIAKQIALAYHQESDYIPPAEVMEAYLLHLPKASPQEQDYYVESQLKVLALDKKLLQQMQEEMHSPVSMGNTADAQLMKAFLEKNMQKQEASIKLLEMQIKDQKTQKTEEKVVIHVENKDEKTSVGTKGMKETKNTKDTKDIKDSKVPEETKEAHDIKEQKQISEPHTVEFHTMYSSRTSHFSQVGGTSNKIEKDNKEKKEEQAQPSHRRPKCN